MMDPAREAAVWARVRGEQPQAPTASPWSARRPRRSIKPKRRRHIHTSAWPDAAGAASGGRSWGLLRRRRRSEGAWRRWSISSRAPGRPSPGRSHAADWLRRCAMPSSARRRAPRKPLPWRPRRESTAKPSAAWARAGRQEPGRSFACAQRPVGAAPVHFGAFSKSLRILCNT